MPSILENFLGGLLLGILVDVPLSSLISSQYQLLQFIGFAGYYAFGVAGIVAVFLIVGESETQQELLRGAATLLGIGAFYGLKFHKLSHMKDQ